MLDLGTPQTREECSKQAKQYAEHILSMPGLKTMAHFRLSLKPDEHPSWFFLWLDVEIDRIKFRIDTLSGWKKACDPHGFACGTEERIEKTDHMMRLSLGKAHSRPWLHNRHIEWLKQLHSQCDEC